MVQAKPVAMGYNFVTPDVVKKGVNNFYNNITDFITVLMTFFQLNSNKVMMLDV